MLSSNAEPSSVVELSSFVTQSASSVTAAVTDETRTANPESAPRNITPSGVNINFRFTKKFFRQLFITSRCSLSRVNLFLPKAAP
ncbi:MAG TPA: hypothetical protein DIV38_00205 [Clostridiales bacterium]|nr:hypothetical protein [Clostridiales bacterium]